MILLRRPGGSLILALFALSLAGCDKGFSLGGNGSGGVVPELVKSADVLAFYEGHEWKRVWDKNRQNAILNVFAQAPANGLNPALFLKMPLPGEKAERDVMLSEAAFAYAKALAHGYVDPAKTYDIYTIPRPTDDGLAKKLAEAIDRNEIADFFASLPPRSDEYKALSEAHLRYVALAKAGGSEAVPDGPSIKPGAKDARVPSIAKSLVKAGYLAPSAGGAVGSRFTPQIVDAVKRLQGDIGLTSDGIIGGDTLDAINAGAAGRARQTAVALERLRWLTRDAPETRVDVNLAAATMQTWFDGQQIDERRVVVGDPDKKTPQLQSTMFQVVANPKWRIPDSIVKGELADKSPAALAAQGIGTENGRLVQKSGPKNSLGEVKFDLRNKHAIYLHDTPAKALFAIDDRHRSHGCVRVSNALDYAMLLTGKEGVEDRFMDALATGDEHFVGLKKDIPVRLLYHTAFYDGEKVVLLPDVYGWDDEVARGLGLEKISRRIRPTVRTDLGP